MEIILPEDNELAEFREYILEKRKSDFFETLVCIPLAIIYITLTVWVIVTIARLMWT